MTDAETATTTAGLSAIVTPARQLPGDPGMWVFVLGDLVIFSVYFIIFMIHRLREPAQFLASQHHLSPTTPAVGTLILLTSSWFAALAVVAARDARYARAARLLYATGGCGVLFLAIKAFEWTAQTGDGHTVASNTFFMFYYALTGVHLVHVVMGLIVLGVVRRQLRAPGDRAVWAVETGAVYWHMVDLLWIVIFALVFVLR